MNLRLLLRDQSSSPAGNCDDPAPDVMTTIVNVFKNAFIKAFEGKLENENVELPKVDKEKH